MRTEKAPLVAQTSESKTGLKHELKMTFILAPDRVYWNLVQNRSWFERPEGQASTTGSLTSISGHPETNPD